MDDDRCSDRALTPVTPDDSGAEDTPLALHHITRRFGDITALDDVSFVIRRGRITALLGENGAGKTTLMRIAFGMIQPDDGWISINGTRRVLQSPADAIAAGIGMVHQQFSLIPAMTVAENVALGGRGRYSFERVSQRLRTIGTKTGLLLDPSRRVADLSNAERQRLEIIRTFAHDARIMILDEPTAVLTPADTTELFGQLKDFTRSGGSVVLITHRLADAIEHADDVSVLRHGRMALTSPIADVTDRSLSTAMLGSTPQARPAAEKHSRGIEQIASLHNVVLERTHDHTVNLSVHAGEIVGVAALEGAASILLRTLAGRLHPVSGHVILPERIGFVPENRHEEALIPDFTLVENLALANAAQRHGILDWEKLRQETLSVMQQYRVHSSGIEATPRQLSGGNQQRFVLGRELRRSPQLLVLENPTQGLDIGASAFIHDQVRAAREGGAAIVVYSSDLDELVSLADRVIIASVKGLVEVAVNRDAIGNALLGTQP